MKFFERLRQLNRMSFFNKNLGKFQRYTSFTLAEVLIVLGIIGIVAALTIPALITNVKHQELESSFKKAYASLSDASLKAISETPQDAGSYEGQRNSDFIVAVYAAYQKSANVSTNESQSYANSIRTYTYAKAVAPECSQLFGYGNGVVANDGSAIAMMRNCGYTWATVDINGLTKGPNAYGHDVFLFTVDTVTGKVSSAIMESEANHNQDGSFNGYNNTGANAQKCSKTAASSVNGVTCAQFAIRNICPDDPTKTYWDCLP